MLSKSGAETVRCCSSLLYLAVKRSTIARYKGELGRMHLPLSVKNASEFEGKQRRRLRCNLPIRLKRYVPSCSGWLYCRSSFSRRILFSYGYNWTNKLSSYFSLARATNKRINGDSMLTLFRDFRVIFISLDLLLFLNNELDLKKLYKFVEIFPKYFLTQTAIFRRTSRKLG